MDRDPFRIPYWPETFVRSGFDRHLFAIEVEKGCELLADPWDLFKELGLLSDDRGIEIPDPMTLVLDLLLSEFQEHGAGSVPVGRIIIGEMSSDVSKGQSTEHGIDQRVDQDIAIGMGH